MEKIINFDMDGTLADFYGVEKWLENLQEENTRPYEIAQTLVDTVTLETILEMLQDKGYEINIISWGAKNSTQDFLERTTKAKKEWLAKYNLTFNNVYVVPYGTPKDSIKKGILFDDDESVRNGYNGIAFSNKDIMSVLYMLLFED